MRSLIALMVAVLGIAITGPEVYAGGENWLADLYICVGPAHNRLIVGQDEQATEGPDNLWESPVPGQFLIGLVCSYFYHPEWKQETPFFWRDVRPLGGLPREWEFVVKTKEPNVEVQIKWDLTRVKKGIQLYLKGRGDEKQVNLNQEAEYTYKIAEREKVFLIKAVAE